MYSCVSTYSVDVYSECIQNVFENVFAEYDDGVGGPGERVDPFAEKAKKLHVAKRVSDLVKHGAVGEGDHPGEVMLVAPLRRRWRLVTLSSRPTACRCHWRPAWSRR